MPELKLYDQYSREDVHDIFAPDSSFTRQAGTWGLHGIIELPDRPADFVLFVTFGREQSGHEFDEGISDKGVLRWQSQPRQTLNDKIVQRLIAHDENVNSVYLFLRTNARLGGEAQDYTYLGKLKYAAHDNQRERPVYFDWQLLSWPIAQSVIQQMGLRLEGSGVSATVGEADREESVPVRLIADVLTPLQGPRRGAPTRLFKGRMAADYAVVEKANRNLGWAGEKLVVEYEKEALRKLGRPDLASRVRHVSAKEGDGAGYDVLSFQPDGKELYIEVKTTCGTITSEFYVSPNEVAFSRHHADRYELRRLYKYDKRLGSCRFFSIYGDLAAHFELTPTEFKVSNLSVDEYDGAAVNDGRREPQSNLSSA
jgi:hypothetical protein